jgi:hypothetical protein
MAGISTDIVSKLTVLSTGTNADGSPTTFSSVTTQTFIPTDDGNSKGYSESDKIALGVGIGIGVPTFFVGLLALFIACGR